MPCSVPGTRTAAAPRVVIDQVQVRGGAGYRSPHVLSVLEAGVRHGQCGGTFLWESPEKLLDHCAIGGFHRLTGVRLPGNNPGVNLIFKIGPPVGRSDCWTLSASGAIASSRCCAGRRCCD